MNSLFYESIDRIPLGVAVTAEFLGPLLVAALGSRRVEDFLWVVLAGAGVALLGSPSVDVDRVGLLLALGAGGVLGPLHRGRQAPASTLAAPGRPDRRDAARGAA